MAAFTVNSTTSRGPWLVVDGYSTDVSGTEIAILAAVTGHEHLVKSISINYGKVDKWVQVLDGSDLQIGPFLCGTKNWEKTFEDGMTFKSGVYIETESDAVIHVMIEYKVVPII